MTTRMNQHWAQWQREEIDALNHAAYPHVHSYSELLQQALYTNSLHGSNRFLPEYLTPRGMVTDWHGLDSEEQYLKNCEDPEARAQLERWGWLGVRIKYEHNSWGFRSLGSREFFKIVKPSLVAIGCSFTYGTGLHYQDLWCKRLADLMDLELINLGVPGHGLSLSTQWLLDQGHQLHKPQAIVIYVPPPGRLSWITPSFGYAVGNTFNMSDFERYVKVYENLSVNAFADYVKNYNTIKLWADHRNIPVYTFTHIMGKQEEFGLARDLRHHGVGWHKTAANFVHTEIINKTA